ncbi:hypothetical protein [Thiolapillus sp.]
MSDTVVIFAIFFTALILGRYLNHQGIRQLNRAQKASLFDVCGGFSVWSMLPLLILGLGLYVAMTHGPEQIRVVLIGVLLLLMVVYVVGLQVYIFRKLKRMDFPQAYINRYMAAVAVRVVGVAALLYPVVTAFTQRP